jgi:hypothetical protein
MTGEDRMFYITLFVIVCVVAITAVCIFSIERESRASLHREMCDGIRIMVHDGEIEEYEVYCQPQDRSVKDGLIKCDILVSVNEVWCWYDSRE